MVTRFQENYWQMSENFTLTKNTRKMHIQTKVTHDAYWEYTAKTEKQILKR